MSSQRKGRRAGGAGASGSVGWLAALAACLAASLTGCQLAARVLGPVSLPCVFRGEAFYVPFILFKNSAYLIAQLVKNLPAMRETLA